MPANIDSLQLDHAILNNLTIVLGPPQRAPDAELLKEILHQQRLRVIMVVPAILEQLLHDETAVSMLTDLELVGCAGSPLPGPVGDRISAEVKLRVFIGSTETFPLPELEKDPMDWQYRMHKTMLQRKREKKRKQKTEEKNTNLVTDEFAASLDHEMRPYDAESGTFELIIFANEANKDSAPLFHNLPGIGTFYTKDLFTRHPRNPRLYKYYGPKDDIIVLANGEKINPIPLEQAIQGHTKLKGALLIGNGRTQSLLLIEPKESLEEIEHSTLVQHLWPLIEKANEHIPGPGRVLPGMVLCVLPEKPFVRPGKGSIIRKLTEDLYQDEIDTRYTNRGEEQQITAAGLRSRQNKAYDDAEIVEFLREALGKCFAPAIEIGEDEDFFAHGLDSIRVLEITRALKNNLAGITSNPVTWVAPRFIFQYPTLATLSRVLRLFLNDGQLPNAESAQDRSKALSAMVSLHLENLPMVSKNESAAGHQRVLDLHVAVIGSTGYVGGHVVATLLRSPSVSKIWCLNRASEADARQRTLGKLEADLSDFQEKLAFLRIELRAPRLGLNEDQYRHLVTSVDTILYNAWRLDFGSTLNSFDPFLCATRTIINMSLDSPNKCRIVFTSSTSSVGDLVAHGRKIPEHVIEDALAAINIGYAQSKLAAEIILATASRHCGIPTAVVRVGQVGGLADGGGIWADQPWISSIIQSSKKIGCFPTSVMPIDWVPVDTLSVILASIILGPFDKSQMCQFYNVVSEPQPWTVLLEALPEELCKTISKTISLPHWVERIQQICDTTRDGLLILRASRLLDFYKTLGHGVEVSDFETDRTSIINGQKLAAPTTEVLASWLRSWDI